MSTTGSDQAAQSFVQVCFENPQGQRKKPLWETCSAPRKIDFYLYVVLYWIQPYNHLPFQ